MDRHLRAPSRPPQWALTLELTLAEPPRDQGVDVVAARLGAEPAVFAAPPARMIQPSGSACCLAGAGTAAAVLELRAALGQFARARIGWVLNGDGELSFTYVGCCRAR